MSTRSRSRTPKIIENISVSSEGFGQPSYTESEEEPASKQVESLPSHSSCLSDVEADIEVRHTTRRGRRKREKSVSKQRGSTSSLSQVISSRPHSTFSTASRTTFATDDTGFTSDYSDSLGLLQECGYRIVDDDYTGTGKRRRRKRRGNGWTRQKGSYRSRSCSTYRTNSRLSRKTNTSGILRTDARAKQLVAKERNNNLRLKNMFNDILSVEGNLRDFTTAYLIQEKHCYEFYESDEEEKPVAYVKTRNACKVREEVLRAFHCSVFECSKCNYCSLQPFEVTDHMVKSHNYIPLYICRECKTKFVLKNHFEKHKEKNHDRIFKGNCLFCSKDFVHRKAYEEHMDQYLNGCFKCTYCGDIYLDKYSYRSHVRKRHSGKKFCVTSAPSCIISRVDYPKSVGSCRNCSDSEFVRVLIQPGRYSRSDTYSPTGSFDV